MHTCASAVHRSSLMNAAIVAVLVGFVPALALRAQAPRKSPTSKIYVANLTGETQINRDDKVEMMSTKSAYTAEHSIIETKPKATNALIYSNGTGLFLDSDTRIEVQKFIQDPFTPNHNDLEVEPSRSQTEVTVARGLVGLCTSKLVAGSTMKYQTSFGSVSILGGKLIIEAEAEQTKISMLEGEGIVRGGNLDLGGQVLHPGQQAIIRLGAAHAANSVEIRDIPASDRAALDDKVFPACTARKTVFFDTRDTANGAEIVSVPVVPPSLAPTITVSPSRLPK